MAKRGCKTHFTFDDLNGKTIEFDIPNESGHNYWGRGELEVEEIVNGLIDIKVVTVSIDDEKLEMLVKVLSLKRQSIDSSEITIKNSQIFNYMLMAGHVAATGIHSIYKYERLRYY